MVYQTLSIDVLQGNKLAPYLFIYLFIHLFIYLFILVMDYIMRLAIPHDKNYGFECSERKSSRQPAQKIAELLFADDIALLSGDIKERQNILDDVSDRAKLVGLQINTKKTQWLVVGKEVNTKECLINNNIQLEKVEDY